MRLPITPVPADDLLMSIAFVLLVVLVVALIGFVVWLGRKLMLQMLATRQVAESQRLARREQQFKGELHRAKSERWHVAPSSGSGPMVIQRTPLPPKPPPKMPKPGTVAQRKVAPAAAPMPPPLPPVALKVDGVGDGPAPDWSDSRPFTELDLRPDTVDLTEQDLDEGEREAPAYSGEHYVNPHNATEPFELLPERSATAVWPHRKLPPRSD